MSEKIKVQEIEEKKTQNGKIYLRVKTDWGWMSCFDSELFEILRKAKDKELIVEIAESGDGKFKNISKIEQSIEIEKIEEKQVSKDKSIYTSYAKDIYIAFQGKLTIEQCVEIVKKAKSYF